MKNSQKSLKILLSIFLAVFISACSGTTQVSSQQINAYQTNNSQVYPEQMNVSLNKNKYASTTNFPHTRFTAVNSETIKKQLGSDHQLMMSLLNRPMTDDQKMMLAFAKQREQEATYYNQSAYASYVTIKGSSTETPTTVQASNIYSTLIANDINSVVITGAL